MGQRPKGGVKKFLKEFVIETKHNVKDLTNYCLQNGFLILNISDTLENCFQIAITEKRTKEEKKFINQNKK